MDQSSIQAQHSTLLQTFWQTQLQLIDQEPQDYKSFQLPLARIKKVMKTDEDVQNMMISGEAPIIFAKACEIFVLELTLRAWTNTEESKRRTLQRSDVATAVSKNDTFDFLIDIVPREEAKLKRTDIADYRTASVLNEPGFFYGNQPSGAPDAAGFNQGNMYPQP